MWWIICIFLFLPGSVISRPRCGGTHTAARGVIQSPNFPNKFPVPIHCEWIIDAQHVASPNSTIKVYFTQLFVFEGLSFKEYQIYDSTYQLNGRDIHTVTETNVTKVSVIESKQDYLVITLKLDTIESTHLRVLDHLLDVYGFNITYEISPGPPRMDRCTMMDCGFTGTCHDHYTRFSCDCFDGYEGPKCSEGPNSLCTPDICKNGGTCTHIGDSAVRCECGPGFTGEYCDARFTPPAKECEDCLLSCPFDGREENICKCPGNGESPNETRNTDAVVAYAVTIKLMNVSNMKAAQLRGYIEGHIAKLLRDAAPSIRDVRASQLGSESSHVEVTLQMVVDKREERRVRSTLAKWSERSHIGNLTLVPHQSITLIPQEMPKEQNISLHPSGLVHAGENLVLSCRTSGGGVGSFGGGGSQPSFRWFKDGLFVNVTEPTSNKWIKEYEDSETRDQYVSELGIKNASPIDQGSFTCQTVEDGMQKCLSKRVDVRAAPRVWIEPMSLTVRKGENFTIKCFSMSSGRRHKKSKYTYSWTKNKELLPIKTDTEHYEVLFPMGSILQVSSINKSTQFSCLVQDSAVWAEQSILVNVIDSHLIKTCPGERKLKLLWPETAPGTESLQECPAGYSGVARRACNLRDAGQPTWYLPDFAGCTPTKLIQLDYDFQKIRLGYGSGNALTILKGYKKYLVDGKSALLPGEGSRILGLVHEVISYINNSIATDVRNTVLEIVDQILQRKQAVINQTQVVLLQRVVKEQSLAFRSTFHRALSAVDVTLSSADKTEFHVPIPGRSYPTWFSYKLHLALPQRYFASPNKSATLAVVVYRNLSAFLPQRSAIRLKDGIEMDYEVISNIATAWLKHNGSEKSGNLSDGLFTMEFNHQVKNESPPDSWKIVCGVADYASYGYSWDTQSCLTRNLEPSRTRCLCPRSGTFAILLTMKPSFVENEVIPVRQFVILIGCTTCTLLTAVSGLILSFYWYFRRSCLVFLKVQCCLSLSGSMIVFIYALWDDVANEFFLTVMSFLESFLLTGMSSQLSNLLIIYSELVQLPRMKSVKQTVVLIITGAPMIAVFGNHMAHLTMNSRINSWWLLNGTLSFNIFVACCSIIVLLYAVLYYIVVRKLTKINTKFDKPSEPLLNRLKLLRRSALVFTSITITIFGSVLYINSADNVLYHYVFSSATVVMGTVIFFSYVLFSETPLKKIINVRLLDAAASTEKLSPDTGKHLKFFTNQKAEVENESTPYFCRSTAETCFSHEIIKVPEIGSTSFKTYASATFPDPSSSQHQQDLQFYEGSPKHFNHHHLHQHNHQRDIINSPDLLGTKKFVELDLVASSVQKSVYGTQPPLPSITITQPEVNGENNLERQRPEGEEKTVMTVELVPIVSVMETTVPIKGDNLDAVMDSITLDLDYLLNGNDFDEETEGGVSNTGSVGTQQVSTATAIPSGPRRISRPPSLSVFEQIIEEPEEDMKVPEAITNVSRTNC